jgi:hypothetical protein
MGKIPLFAYICIKYTVARKKNQIKMGREIDLIPVLANFAITI